MALSIRGNSRMLGMLACATAAVCCLPARSHAEVFVLRNGGRIEGQITNPEESPRKTYVVKLDSGASVTLEKSQVKEVIRRRPEEIEYDKIRSKYEDTAEGQWSLSEWCREHHLSVERKKLLKHILELDPEHVQARRGLGYVRSDGQWKTHDEVMTERGYVRDGRGKWKLPQEIELSEERRNNELKVREWYTKLKRWRGWLDSDRAAEAIESINAIEDPYAVDALAHYLKEDTVEANRKLYIETLGRINVPQSYRAMAQCYMVDPSDEIRQTCLDYLDNEPRPAVVEVYVKALKHKENVIVNRAAVGLARMKDPSAIGPLIDALITSHKFRLPNQPGTTTSSFGTTGNSFSYGKRPEFMVVKLQNQDVLDALVILSDGANFQYDVAAWKKWLARKRKPTKLDARRD